MEREKMTMESTTKLEFKKTRAINWFVAIFLFVGSFLMALKASSAFGSLVTICLVMFLLIAPYVISAIVLSSDDFYFFGVSLPLTATKRDLLRKVAWYWNWLILVISVIGIVMSISTQQPMVVVPLLIYFVPSLLNLIALRKLRNSLLR